LTRFIAVCLLSGYVWLAVGGAVIAVAGLAPGSAAYDAALHALLLGFVFAMVFGHAPVIFPAVLRVAVPYDASFYAPLALLHAALALRVGGDVLGAHEAVRWGALASALALLAFIANTVRAVIAGRRTETRRRHG
jgi:heme exporter protein D